MAGEFYEQAAKKLDKELRSVGFDRYGVVMKQAVHDALLKFCRQEDEFAQAVVQGGSFGDCMKAVSGCVKNQAISDMEAYGAAVRFYFPGAEIRVSMTIDLIGQAGGPTAPGRSVGSIPADNSPSDNNPRGDASASASGRDSLLIDLSEFF